MNQAGNKCFDSIFNLQDLFYVCCDKYKSFPLVKIRNKNQIEEITYKKVWDDACGIANYFIDKGYDEEYIPLLGAFCYEWLVVFMAIEISGNVAVPLENDSEESLNYISELNVKLLYIDGKYQKSINSFDFVDLILSNCDEIGDININRYEKTIDKIALPKIEDAQSAIVIFTSGTTGKSKGVVLTHKNIIADTKCCLTYIDDVPSENSCTIPVLPVTHMFEITVGILTAFYYGIPLCYGGGLKYFSKNMKTFKPDIMVLVPLIVENLYQKITQKEENRNKIAKVILFSNFLRKIGLDFRKKIFKEIHESLGGNLSVIICGGAYLSDKIIKWWDDIGISVRCGYGITECSPVISCNYPEESCKKSVGKISPMRKCDIKIIDEEICVAGDIVFKEYLNDKKATEEAFDGKYFKTGDLGYVDKNGFIFITGRKKNLIVLGDGNNVSPEEIEAYFSGEKIIKDLIVILKRYDGKEYITALINIDEEYVKENCIVELRKYIWEIIEKVNYKLPSYKRIKKIEIIEEEFEKTYLKKIKRYKYQNT